jgi:hypothetical protein
LVPLYTRRARRRVVAGVGNLLVHPLNGPLIAQMWVQ